MKTYDVWKPDEGEERGERRPVRAHDEKDAAEKWAQRDDWESNDYTIVGGENLTVHVAERGSERVRIFEVTGEAVPTYIARELRAESDSEGARGDGDE